MHTARADGSTHYQHLSAAARMGAPVPELDPPAVPAWAPVLIDIFWKLRQSLRGNGFGVPGIALQDLVAWQTLYRARLLPHEVDLLLQLDAAFVAALPKAETKA